MERCRVMFFVNCFKYIAVPSTVKNYGCVTPYRSHRLLFAQLGQQKDRKDLYT